MFWLQRLGLFFVMLGAVVLWQGACGPNADCNIDSDCSSGYTCQMNNGAKRCISTTCTPSCTTSQQCIAGRCVQNEPVVTPDRAAEPSPDGTCSGTGCPCNQDSNCDSNLQCLSGVCAPRGEGISETTTPDGGSENTTNPETSPTEEAPSPEQTSPETSAETTPEATNEGGTPEGSVETTPEATVEGTPEIPETTDGTSSPDTAPCQKDADCGRGRVCKQGVCEVAPPVVCTPACSATQQCTASGCVAEPTAGIGQDCATQACAQGLECVQVSSSASRCFQPCQNSQDCQQNTLRKACYFLGGTKSYCIQEAGNGQSCGLTGTVQALCDSVTVCQQGTCQATAVVSPNQRCGVQGKVCPMDYLCLGFPDGSGGFIRYCMKDCTYNSTNPQSNCATGYTCEQLSGTRGFCTPNGTAQADDLCGEPQSGDNFDVSKSCAPSLACVGLARSICLPFAEGDCTTSGLQCPSGRQCAVISGGGKSYSICNQVCSSTSACSKPYLSCDTSRNQCWPSAP
ncbi:MAG: hypothetical protein H6728_17525 [Myxococcales bacterium]|nr:hypothetical protein [Myxococcales bacterium]